MSGGRVPLTPALSPEGRGSSGALGDLRGALTCRLPCRVQPDRWRFPLPSGERARVRGRAVRQREWQKSYARDLRQQMTEAERVLWFALRDRRLCGAKFRRQVPVGPYIADFYCAAHRLILEVDGGQHGGLCDAQRDRWLAGQGFRVLRVWNSDVRGNLPGVMQMIAEELRR